MTEDEIRQIIELKNDIQQYTRAGRPELAARWQMILNIIMPKDPRKLRALGEALLRRCGRSRGGREYATFFGRNR